MRPTTFREARQWLSFYAACLLARDKHAWRRAVSPRVQETLSIRCTIAVIYRRGATPLATLFIVDILQSLEQLPRRRQDLNFNCDFYLRCTYLSAFSKSCSTERKILHIRQKSYILFFATFFRANAISQFSSTILGTHLAPYLAWSRDPQLRSLGRFAEGLRNSACVTRIETIYAYRNNPCILEYCNFVGRWK